MTFQPRRRESGLPRPEIERLEKASRTADMDIYPWLRLYLSTTRDRPY